MGQRKLLSDEEIKGILNDPNTTDADLRLLTPYERDIYNKMKRSQTVLGRGEDLAKGALKGAGETAFNLGKMVHNTPVLGDLTDALSKQLGGVDPNAAFASTPGDLEAANTTQSLGKMLEQMGEFFVPAGPARGAAIEKIVGMLPNAMKNPALMNKLAAIAGRTVGEAGSATAVSALHGNDHPEVEGAMAGAGPLLGAGAEAIGTPAFRALAGTPLGREILGMAAGGLTVGAMPNVIGLGASMGTYGLTKRLARDAAKNITPRAIRAGAQTGRKVIETGARGAAAMTDAAPSRRRLGGQ